MQTGGKVLSTSRDVLIPLQTLSLSAAIPLQNYIMKRLKPIPFEVFLGEWTHFHDSCSAVLSALGLVEAIGSAQSVQGIKRDQLLS